MNEWINLLLWSLVAIIWHSRNRGGESNSNCIFLKMENSIFIILRACLCRKDYEVLLKFKIHSWALFQYEWLCRFNNNNSSNKNNNRDRFRKTYICTIWNCMFSKCIEFSANQSHFILGCLLYQIGISFLIIAVL